jgi:hypothetical protein
MVAAGDILGHVGDYQPADDRQRQADDGEVDAVQLERLGEQQAERHAREPGDRQGEVDRHAELLGQYRGGEGADAVEGDVAEWHVSGKAGDDVERRGHGDPQHQVEEERQVSVQHGNECEPHRQHEQQPVPHAVANGSNPLLGGGGNRHIKLLRSVSEKVPACRRGPP